MDKDPTKRWTCERLITHSYFEDYIAKRKEIEMTMNLNPNREKSKVSVIRKRNKSIPIPIIIHYILIIYSLIINTLWLVNKLIKFYRLQQLHFHYCMVTSICLRSIKNNKFCDLNNICLQFNQFNNV